MPLEFVPDDYFFGCYGISRDGGDCEMVILRASERQSKYLRALPLHLSQRETETCVFEYYLRPHSYDFVQVLFSMLSEIEVLEPVSLREQIHQIASKYGE